jgi:CBS domain-containing protein
MTKDPKFCVPSDSATAVAKLMRREDVGSVPICADRQSRKLLGIVTDRDLALQIVGEQLDPAATTVHELMTRQPITCRPEDDLAEALEAMERHQLRRIPIVDESGKLAGIISQADVATRLSQTEVTAEVVEMISRPPVIA